MADGRKSSKLVKSHELICHFIRLYLVPLPPYSELKTSFWIFLTFILDVDEDLYQVIGTKVGTLRFKCSVCSHKSRYKQGIIDHVKQVHRKERPYACTTCERSFFRKTDLRIHIRSVGLLSLLWGVKILYIFG